MSFYPWFCRFAVTMLPKAMTRNMASLITRSRKGEKGQKITEIQVSVKSLCETMLPHGSEGSRTAREKRRFCSFSSFCEKNFCKTMLPLICKTMGKMTPHTGPMYTVVCNTPLRGRGVGERRLFSHARETICTVGWHHSLPAKKGSVNDMRMQEVFIHWRTGVY